MNLQRRLLTLTLACCALPGCTARRGPTGDEESSSAAALVAVKTAPVIRGDMEITVTATGSTDALRREKIIAPIAGTLLAVRVLEGTRVHRGDVLAVIQPKETRAAITGAAALLRAAGTDEERREAKRAMSLALASRNDLDVLSTTDGVVATRSAVEGELVAENAELMTVVDLSTLIFVADVPLSGIAAVRRGERAVVSFQALPGGVFGGQVDAVNPRTDPASQSVRVMIGFARPDPRRMGLLRSDMSGVARIITGRHPGVLIIPKQALLRNDETDAYTVVVATADSLARIVPVEVGARTDTTAEVSAAGLLPGTRVVVEGNYALADSTRIVPGE